MRRSDCPWPYHEEEKEEDDHEGDELQNLIRPEDRSRDGELE
jgi:hypothetical protein